MASSRFPSAATSARFRSRLKLELLPGALILGLMAVSGMAAEQLAMSPFSARSTPDGETMFTEVSPERSGIVTTNRYDDPRMWGKRHREYHVGATGSGVAVGDYDGDGKPDIFIVSKVESGRLFRNLGDWRFEDVTDKAGVRDDSGEWKQGAAFVDVNNDGRLDLYICRFDAPNRLHLNQGDGTFKEEAADRGLAVVDASNMACFADYDRDGWLDVYLQTNLRDGIARPRSEPDYLFHNNGDGTFQDVTRSAGILPTGTQGHSATWWDQDDDGWLDLYVANDFDSADFLYRNNRDGTFSNAIDESIPYTPFSGMGSDLGDVDNDGHIDFFVADMAGTTHEKTQRGLSDAQTRTGAALNDRTDTTLQLLRNMLYVNTGTPHCLEAAYLTGLAATDWTWSPRFEDLDQDGRLDLFVTTGMDREQTNLDMIEKRLAALSEGERIRITRNSPVMKEANLAYANRGELRFEEVGKAWGLDHVGVSFGSAFGDFDGDGDLDLVYTNYQEGATLLRNDSQRGNSVIIALRGTASNRFGLGTRVEATTTSGTQVRQLISARGYQSTSEPVVHFGFGDEQTIERLKLVWPSGREQVFEKLAVGRRYTITEPEEDASLAAARARSAPQAASGRLGEASLPASNAAGTPGGDSTPAALQFENVSVALGLAITQREEPLEGTVEQPLLPRRFNRRGPGIAVGDIDGDGIDEIVLGATTRDGAKILRREGQRHQILNTDTVGDPPAVNDGPPLVFDANGDGANDLLLTAGGAALPAEEPEYEPRLWLNDRQGRFAPAPRGFLPSAPISVGAAVAADFNRDGKLDLFLGGRLFPGFYPEPPASALLLQGADGWADATETFAPTLRNIGLVTSSLATDVDGDGWIDLVVALEWGGVRFFRNEEGHNLSDVSTAWGFDTAGMGLWTSLAAADFNHDGRLDYAVGNLGLNTMFRASPEHPLRLFSADFAGSGKPQLVLAHSADGRLLPFASRSELASKIPAVRQRFPSNNRYAAAALDEILGKEALANAEVREAGELRSGVLLSQPSGRYAFAPLPRRAQIAPVQGMVAADFNGDGDADLLLATNDYSPAPAIGRFAGGLGWLLLGDGGGNFRTVPVAKSGWLVAGDAKALAAADLDRDGRPDAIVSRNNESTLAFRNAGVDGPLRLAVRLRGRSGNPDAIGARLQLESGGRTLQIVEINAGGGFVSQSTATAFFAIPEKLATDARIRVRWPSGSWTEVPCPSEGGYLEIGE